MKYFLASLGLVGVGVGLTMRSNAVRWNRNTRQIVERLKNLVPDPDMKTVTFEDFNLLPEPVAKYLRLALKDRQPLIRSVRIKQVGELRGLGKSQDNWMSFKASQLCSAMRPGFMWDARIRASPLIFLQVRDTYITGQGEGQVSVCSLVPLADEHGKQELTEGALMRYLAESVWFPTALLPSTRLAWTPIDTNKALATLTDDGTSVSLEFQFNAAGEVTGVYASGRYRAVEGKYVLTPWGGQHRSYEERHGMWIPMEGEVEWHLPEGTVSVWKGKIADVKYDDAGCENAPNEDKSALPETQPTAVFCGRCCRRSDSRTGRRTCNKCALAGLQQAGAADLGHPVPNRADPLCPNARADPLCHISPERA